MGRIEDAMEKAAALREGKQAQPAEPSPPLEAHKEIPPLPRRGQTDQPLSPCNPFLVNLHDPHSLVAEEYRKLKFALIKLSRGERFRNTIMVTSSVPKEGKSLTALNLAMSLAQDFDHTVLLIDADLRAPSLHRYLEIEQGAGLADLLLGKAEIAETLVHTGIGQLSVMRAGSYIENPVELFSSQRMKELISEIKERYADRFVIFDTSPVLPFAEGRTLAHLVDGVLFVVRERQAGEETIREAFDTLKGTEVFGIVYNGSEVHESDERYSYYRNYLRPTLEDRR